MNPPSRFALHEAPRVKRQTEGGAHGGETLLSHLSNFFLLPSQFECDRHDHLDGNRLIIQIRRFILPFLQRIQCSLVQERWSGHDLHVDNIPLPIQDCVNLYLTLNVCLPRQWRIIGTHLRDRLRRPYAPAYTHRHCFFRWWRGEGFRTGIQHSSDHTAKHSSHLPAGHSARHTTGYSAETIRLKWSFLDLRDLLGDCGWCDEFPASHERASVYAPSRLRQRVREAAGAGEATQPTAWSQKPSD
jgi:hypothetical protein